MTVLIVIYAILGYWATGKTIYRNRVMITTYKNYFFSRLIYGILFGFLLIPYAIIRELVGW